MAENITINFLSRGLAQAKTTAAAIAKQVKEASKNLKELAPEARRQFAARQRELAKVRQDEIKTLQTRLGLERRAAGVAGRGLGASAALQGNIGKGKAAAETIRGVGTSVLTGNVTQGLELFSRIPVVGQVAAGVGAVVAVVLPILQRELDARVAAMETRSAVIQRRAFLEADVARRFQDDPEFRDRLTRDAVRSEMRSERALRGGGWRHRGRHMVGE